VHNQPQISAYDAFKDAARPTKQQCPHFETFANVRNEALARFVTLAAILL